MNKAKIVLLLVTTISALGFYLAAKAKNRVGGVMIFYTTNCITPATKTVTHATIVQFPSMPALRVYWTTVEGTVPPCANYGYLVKVLE